MPIIELYIEVVLNKKKRFIHDKSKIVKIYMYHTVLNGNGALALPELERCIVVFATCVYII